MFRFFDCSYPNRIATIKELKQDSYNKKSLSRKATIKEPRQDSYNQRAIMLRLFDCSYPV
jgi:hypothetical protein